MYALKRSVSIHELHKLDDTLSRSIRRVFYTLALGTIINTNYNSSTKGVKTFIAKEQKESIDELPNTIERITNEIEEKTKNRFKIEIKNQ